MGEGDLPQMPHPGSVIVLELMQEFYLVAVIRIFEHSKNHNTLKGLLTMSVYINKYMWFCIQQLCGGTQIEHFSNRAIINLL